MIFSENEEDMLLYAITWFARPLSSFDEITGGVHFSLYTVHFGRHLQIERDFGALFIRAMFSIGWEFLSKTSWVND